ncbi:MAG: mechanosensitive ion channel family protein [Deltaproteobacteria bacterium]|nr:mechanosensitive ion channel family protein [Deltaproteobacteria bacterium]MBW1914092.1 mechanosensitive ion channel family protein [Deltaproteobacteria bacterium]
MYPLIYNWLENNGLGSGSTLIAHGVILIAALTISFITFWVAKKILLVRFTEFVRRSRFSWDDTFLEKGVFVRLLYFIPALIIYLSASALPAIEVWIQRISLACMILTGLFIIDSFLNSCMKIYNAREIAREKPIRGYVQLIKILFFSVGVIFIIATLMNRSPWGLLTGLGAMTAILLLVFKDSILGLIAGFQFSSNNMVHIGDWIEMDKYGADGDVIDISLNSVKIQNWDKTISTIPTYALVSDSFKNWRGMQESGGRRIKRSIYIDMATIKFCTGEMIDRFEKIHYLKNYIRKKQEDVIAHNEQLNIDPDDISGRRMTNIGTFRAYILSYLNNHPKINKEMTFLVRQLEPTPNGLPLQVYVFSNDKVWANYESIQSDIFDHLLAVAPEFDLGVFQNPTGYDFKALTSNVRVS